MTTGSFKNYMEVYMDLDMLQEKLKELHLEDKISLEDIPNIDLYMDQIIQLFENKLGKTKRIEEDKILTKTMVNNYVKGKLLMSVEKKKYSKEHIILMSIICDLKKSLSINDIKSSLNKIVTTIDKGEEYPLKDLYKQYLQQYDNDVKEVEQSISEKLSIIEKNLFNSDNFLGDFEKNFLLLSSLVNMSNMYKIMSEKIIDDYFADYK